CHRRPSGSGSSSCIRLTACFEMPRKAASSTSFSNPRAALTERLVISMRGVNHCLPHASTTIYPGWSTLVDMGTETVGDRLKDLRTAAGLTLEQAGEIAGTTKQSASQIEKG